MRPLSGRVVLLWAVLALLAGPAMARDDAPPIGCKSWSDIPGDYLEKCLLNGGSEVRCSGSTPMCCRKEGDGTHCYADIDDMKRTGTVPMQPAPLRLAPPSMTPPPRPSAPTGGTTAKPPAEPKPAPAPQAPTLKQDVKPQGMAR